MRIASLLPAATEWVCAFGGAADLVGRSHACDFPPPVRALPVFTRTAAPVDGDSAGIDAHVRAQQAKGLSLYEVDLERLRALAPEVILTQAQCAACAVSRAEVEEALGGWNGSRPQVLSLAPSSFKQVLEGALRLGRTIGRLQEAMAFIGRSEQRVRVLRERLGAARAGPPERLPRAACIEWMAPLMTAGHWMPDVVDLAGGRAVLAEPGARSRTVAWADLRAADPDVLCVMPCGFSLAQTRRDLHYLTRLPGWAGLRAVAARRVFLFDGTAYFNRPGPRLYRSVELLAAALHPEGLSGADLGLEAWEMERL